MLLLDIRPYSITTSLLSLLQSGANDHVEEDKRQHPQEGEAPEVAGCAGDPQHPAGGLGDVRVQSREPERRNRVQRTPAGLQWVVTPPPLILCLLLLHVVGLRSTQLLALFVGYVGTCGRRLGISPDIVFINYSLLEAGDRYTSKYAEQAKDS